MCLDIAINRPEHVLSKGCHLGYEWITVHNGMGYRCGYVRVPDGHPWHGKGWDNDISADCHGGITYARHDIPCDAPGPDTAWWIGFDCSHAGDAQDPTLPLEHPSYLRTYCIDGEVVRTQEYVEQQCKDLCQQAAEAIK